MQSTKLCKVQNYAKCKFRLSGNHRGPVMIYRAVQLIKKNIFSLALANSTPTPPHLAPSPSPIKGLQLE